ncbi:hypothetical protein RFM41_31080 [Mesorhizobium sp. VK25A]|uniref:Homogentisate 1,2-dioxygenase N-terminal domain-containing protein n=1 Tax=Mesorhizobium vachelliae TaxID=3072309 RepID=A0ABU5AE34_9HYPH|nr:MULTISPECIES: homogentisate 1,2-dioxygenase [unclassified Mesorhizobium]MDX8535545.1 hypothetical protein [Mesorhizobium sp. VK25D]MDX8548202.1 hypothetical protein [Mesorhizobium sp. VK25A]
MQASQFGAYCRRAASSLHDLFEIGHAFDELANPLLRKPNTHLPGSLPQGRNSPQRPAYGLYAEQLSGSPFIAARGTKSVPGSTASGRASGTPAASRHYLFGKTAPNLGDHEVALDEHRWNPADAERADLFKSQVRQKCDVTNRWNRA